MGPVNQEKSPLTLLLNSAQSSSLNRPIGRHTMCVKSKTIILDNALTVLWNL